MKLQAEVRGIKSEVEIHRDGRCVVAVVDGRRYELDVSEPQTDTYLFKLDQKIFEALTSTSSNSDSFSVSVRNEPFDVTIIDKKRLRNAASETVAADGVVEIRSAMPGKIVRILVNVGMRVKKGDGVIVVEAMKMQNELKSPKDGAVKELRVGVDTTVSAGDVLLTIE
jgi:biotin carboxyl carrier protein